MNNQLPEYDWKRKLYGYSSPVDKRILQKALDAKKNIGDQPLSLWHVFSILVLFISGSLLLADLKDTDPLHAIKNMPVSQDGQSSSNGSMAKDQNTPVKSTGGYTPALSAMNRNKDSAKRFSQQKKNNVPIKTDNTTPLNGDTEQKPVLSPTGHYSFVYSDMGGTLTKFEWQKKHKPADFSYGWNSGHISFSLPPLFLPVEENIADAAYDKIKNAPLLIPECPNVNYNSRNDWYLELFGALDFPTKKIENSYAKSGFTEKKDSTEKFLLSWSAGMRISRNISNSWLVKTGFHFSQFNERFEYRNEQERRITTVVTIRTIIRAPGDTLFITDSSQVEVTGIRIKKTTNRYRNLDIPLLLSYEVRNPGLTVSIQGGTIFNLRSTFKGDMLDTTGLPLSQSGKDPASQFNNSLGFGIYAGASVIKSIGTEFEIFAEPYYRRYLNNQASASAPFKQYLSNWGVQIGVRYKLNRGGQRY
jgi:hypothetical protein